MSDEKRVKYEVFLEKRIDCSARWMKSKLLECVELELMNRMKLGEMLRLDLKEIAGLKSWMDWMLKLWMEQK